MDTQHEVDKGADHEKHRDHAHKLRLTVLFNGKVKEHEFSAHDKVEVVIKDLLPHDEKHDFAKFMLVDQRPEVGELAMNKTLHESGVKDHDTLSLNRRHGGGGQ